MVKIRIVEFMGLPGCGKTTICKSIKDNYKEKNILLIDEYFLPKSIFRKVLSIMRDTSISYLFSLVFYILANNISRKKGMFVYMLNLRMKYARFFREHKNDNSILLVDQGLAQGLGSMSLGNGRILHRGLSWFLRCWKTFEPTMLLVDCKIPIEESAKRLINRNTLGGRFDCLRDSELTKAMMSHTQLLEEVIDILHNDEFHVKYVSITTLETIDNITKNLYREIQ